MCGPRPRLYWGPRLDVGSRLRPHRRAPVRRSKQRARMPLRLHEISPDSHPPLWLALLTRIPPVLPTALTGPGNKSMRKCLIAGCSARASNSHLFCRADGMTHRGNGYIDDRRREQVRLGPHAAVFSAGRQRGGGAMLRAFPRPPAGYVGAG
jgi:hypothetical protein